MEKQTKKKPTIAKTQVEDKSFLDTNVSAYLVRTCGSNIYNSIVTA